MTLADQMDGCHLYANQLRLEPAVPLKTELFRCAVVFKRVKESLIKEGKSITSQNFLNFLGKHLFHC